MIRFLTLLSAGCLMAGAATAAERTAEPHIDLLDLSGCTIGDAARMLTTLTGRTVVASEMARQKTVDALIESLSMDATLKVICRSSGLVYRYDASAGLYTILGLDEYQRTAIEESQGIAQTRTFKVGSANLNQIASAIRQLFGTRVIITGGEQIEDFREIPGQSGGGWNSRSQRMNNARSYGSMGFNSGLGGGGYGGGYGGFGGGYAGMAPGYYDQGAYGYGGGYGGYGYGNGGYGNGNGYGQGYNGYGAYGGYGNNYPGYGFEQNNRFNGNQSNIRGNLDPEQSRMNAEVALEREANRSMEANGTQSATTQKSPSISQPLIYVTTSYEHCFLLVRTMDLEALKEIEKVIADLDKVVPQVILEMKILQLDVGDGLTSGVSVSSNTKNEQFNITERDPITGVETARQFAGFENGLNLGNFASESAATFAYSYLSDQIRARVDLLAKDNRVEVIATPLLVATNNRSAQIVVGEERIITVGATTRVVPATLTTAEQTFVQPQTQKRTIGVVLDILPRINGDGTVTMSVYQESTTLKPANNSIFVGTQSVPIDSVDTANVDATVVATTEKTIAVGGLIRTELGNSVNKVPVLGDIPIMGRLFKRQERSQRKTEIILLITPHILKGDGTDSEVTRKLMEQVSDHRYHVGGSRLVEEDVPALQQYRKDAAASYQKLNNTNQVPLNTEYWKELGANPPPEFDPAGQIIPTAKPLPAKTAPAKKKSTFVPDAPKPAVKTAPLPPAAKPPGLIKRLFRKNP